MTPKIKEFAEKKFPSNDETYYHDVAIQNAFKGGILIGAEFAEWACEFGWEYISWNKNWTKMVYEYDNEGDPYEQNELVKTTTELLDIFITEKMKENEGR